MIGCSNNKNDNVVYIENSFIKVGILPKVGGRLVYYSLINKENILKSDSELWNEPEGDRITPTPFSPFKAYNGFITWVGPQSEWWSNQDINTKKRDEKSVWPPDPFLIYGNFEIINRTSNSITILGPKSPISGVQLTKKYTLIKNKLIIKVDGKNIRDEDISIDLWSNARFDGYTDYIVPSYEKDLFKIEAKESKSNYKLDYNIDEGFFTFVENNLYKKNRVGVGKAYLFPEKGEIIAVKNSTLLLMEFNRVDKELIHENQGFIEVYNYLTNDKNNSLIELEHHSEYRTLKPMESMSIIETWSLYDYNYLHDHRDYYRFYKKIKN